MFSPSRSPTKLQFTGELVVFGGRVNVKGASELGRWECRKLPAPRHWAAMGRSRVVGGGVERRLAAPKTAAAA